MSNTRIFSFMLIAGAALMMFPVCAFAADDAHKSGHPGVNPLIEEMVILDGVFRDVVSGVALADGEKVHNALKSMHGTMEKTHEGVHEGKVTIPKNADRVREFVKMDKRFHRDLEALAHAAHGNDIKAMEKLTGKLLHGCIACHETFRK
ncbi:MAG: cytochrome c [Nitrospirae bacterium]|nr:cytochrome c [Nitrospirota bacterium]